MCLEEGAEAAEKQKKNEGKKEKNWRVEKRESGEVGKQVKDMTNKSDEHVRRTACYSCAPSRSVGY
jgi:hypothetical protein